MRFFFYLKHFPLNDSPCTEGVAKAVHGLATGLAALGRSVTVLGEGPVSGSRRSEFGYDICVFPAPNTHPSVKLSTDLINYVKTEIRSDDRVILNGIFHRSVAAFARLLKRQSIPYIIAPHDPYHPAIFQKNKLLKTVYWWLQEAPMLRSAWAVQILDERHQQYLRSRGVKTRTIALPNGFDAADVVPESSLKWRSSGIPKVYFLGRFDAYNKGLDLLVAAISELLKEHPVELTLQGPEWGDREALKSQVQQLGIESHVTFLEPDYQNSPAKLAMQYDIFTVPSRFEGFSLSALEAMLAGRVIVISEVAGLAPHVEASASGRLVQPTVDSIVSALKQLLECRDRWPEMGRSGRNYALNELQWKKIAESALVGYG